MRRKKLFVILLCAVISVTGAEVIDLDVSAAEENITTVTPDVATVTPDVPSSETNDDIIDSSYKKDGFSYLIKKDGTAMIISYDDGENLNDSIYIPSKIEYKDKEYTVIQNDNDYYGWTGKICSRKKFNADNNNPYYTVKDGVLYSKDMTTLIKVTSWDSKDFNVLSGIKNIYYNAFCSSDIESINLSASVENAQADAFSKCLNLKKITVDSKNTKYKADDNLLYDNRVTDEVWDYDTDKSAVVYCFGDSADIKVADGIRKIWYSVFENNKNIKKIELPDTINEIEECAFKNCSNLDTVVIDKNNIQNVGSFAFDGCSKDLKIVSNGTSTPLGDCKFGTSNQTYEERQVNCGDARTFVSVIISSFAAAYGMIKLKK